MTVRRHRVAPATRALQLLEAQRGQFGAAVERHRYRLLRQLDRATLASAPVVRRLHEALCQVLTYPDSLRVHRLAARILASFDQRTDLRRHARALAGSGIAGTDIPFRFFAPTALWLAQRWPRRLVYDWPVWDDPSRLQEALSLLAVHGETPGLDEWDLGLRGWLERMKPASMGDAAFVLRRLAGRIGDPFVFERLVDGMDAPMVLRAGRDTPSRSCGVRVPRRPVCQRVALSRQWPDLVAELARRPAVRAVPVREGRQLIELALGTMMTHERDLDVFSYGDPRDVRLVDCGEGLQFVAIGALPERRLLLESVYGFLTLRNGVPTGYLLTSALYGSAEVAFNVFDTFRGFEAARTYARVLAMTRRLFGAEAFTVFPYQLGGAGNDEGLDSGAWWFYRRLGFAPRHRTARSLMRREEMRRARDPAYRSSRRTLEQLAQHNMYWHAGRPRADVMGVIPLANVGLAVSDFLARHGGGDPDRGAAGCVREARRLLGAGPGHGWTVGERLAFERWAPLVLLLPGVSRWPAVDRAALVRVIRAKGGRRESGFVTAFDSHTRLRTAIATLARTTRP